MVFSFTERALGCTRRSNLIRLLFAIVPEHRRQSRKVQHHRKPSATMHPREIVCHCCPFLIIVNDSTSLTWYESRNKT
jgi:hypothetical protein